MKKLAALLLTLALSAAAFMTPFIALPVLAAKDYSTIRVRLSASYDDINLGVKGTYLLKETGAVVSSDINISLSGSQLVATCGNSVLYSGTEFTLVRQSGLLRQYSRQHGWRHYLGDMNYKAVSDGLGGYKLAVTNTVGMEDYLIGVVAYEMSNTFPLEALKAQAVAARSYAASKISPSASYDIVDTASDQVYKGYDSTLTNVIAAVNATKGQVLANSSGALVQAYYSASNGGQTESTANAWGSPLPYYQMKDDPYDLRNTMSPTAKLTLPKIVSEASPLDASLAGFLKNQLSPRLSALGYSGFTDTFSILGCSAAVAYSPKYPEPSRSYTRVKLYLTVGVSASGTSVAPPQFLTLEGIPDYVLYVNENRLVTLAERAQIEAAYYASVSSSGGAGGTVPVELDIAFSDLAAAGLYANSSLRMFGVAETATGFELVNSRYGHGVGMSQRGAQQMANEGMSYLDIINFYYSSISISQISTVSATTDAVTGPADPVDFIATLPEPSAVSGKLAAQTAVKSQPSSSASTVVTLKANASVHIVGHHGGWLLVLTASGKCGYLPQDAVHLNFDDAVIAMASEAFNLKADASSSAASLGAVKKGDCVQLIATNGGYYFVDTGETTGFAPKSALALVVGGIEFATSADSRYGYATSAAPLLKSSSSKTVLTTIPEGYVFEVLTQTKDRTGYNVVYNGQKGVVYQAQTKLLSTGAAHPNPRQLLEELSVSLWQGTTRYVANTESLNLRASSSASSAVLGTLAKGEKVVVLDTYASWSKVQAACGLVGFVNSTYLSSSANADTGSTGNTGNTGNTGSSGTNSNLGSSSKVTGTANASSLNIRSGPSIGTASLGKLEKGAVVTLLAQSGDWYKIEYNGVTGYVLKTYITRGAAVQTGTVAASSLNVREKASTTAASLGKLEKGAVVTLAAQSGDWYKIEYGDGYGYVLKTYITRNSSSLPQDSGSSNSGSSNSGSSSSGPSSGGSESENDSAITGVVTASSVNIRASKSTSAQVLGSLQKGAVVKLLAQSSSWYKIEHNGITGYVLKTYVDRGGAASSGSGSTNTGSSGTGYTAVATGVISKSDVNFRKGAGTSYELLGTLQKGASVEIISKSGDYYRIAYSGIVGYVLKSCVGNIVSISGSSGGTPVTNSTQKGKVTASSLKVRSASGSELDRIAKDTLVEIVGESGGNYQVKYNGGAGFVAKSYIKLLSSSAVGVVNASVNFRAGPGTSYEVIETLSAKRIVEIAEDQGEWLKVVADGVTGFISAKFVTR